MTSSVVTLLLLTNSFLSSNLLLLIPITNTINALNSNTLKKNLLLIMTTDLSSSLMSVFKRLVTNTVKTVPIPIYLLLSLLSVETLTVALLISSLTILVPQERFISSPLLLSNLLLMTMSASILLPSTTVVFPAQTTLVSLVTLFQSLTSSVVKSLLATELD